MATIAATSAAVVGDFLVTETAVGAADTFTYDSSNRYLLLLRSTTASSLTVTIDGSGNSAAIPVAGYGTVDATNGKVITVAGNTVRGVRLATISAFLVGTISVASSIPAACNAILITNP